MEEEGCVDDGGVEVQAGVEALCSYDEQLLKQEYWR